MKLTFEGTEEQLDLLKNEFDMLLIEHGDEKLPSIDYLFYYGKKNKNSINAIYYFSENTDRYTKQF